MTIRCYSSSFSQLDDNIYLFISSMLCTWWHVIILVVILILFLHTIPNSEFYTGFSGDLKLSVLYVD